MKVVYRIKKFKKVANLLEDKPLILNENREDWLNISKEIRSEQKLPDIKWD